MPLTQKGIFYLYGKRTKRKKKEIWKCLRNLYNTFIYSLLYVTYLPIEAKILHKIIWVFIFFFTILQMRAWNYVNNTKENNSHFMWAVNFLFDVNAYDVRGSEDRLQTRYQFFLLPPMLSIANIHFINLRFFAF